MSSPDKYCRPEERQTWLFGAGTDLFFISNIHWPVLAWASLQVFSLFKGADLVFWSFLFISIPHRVMTFPVLLSERKKLERHGVLFFLLGVIGFFLVAVLSRYSKGSEVLVYSLAIWNAWHNASQNYGITRIYDRLADIEVKRPRLQKNTLIFALVYVQLRTVTFFSREFLSLGIDISPISSLPFRHLDIPLSLVILFLTALTWVFRSKAVARNTYITQLAFLYCARLLAIHFEQTRWVGALAFTTECCHGIEYLAVSKWALSRREPLHQRLRALHRNDAAGLIVFCILVATCSLSFRQWDGANWARFAALLLFLHFAYDGFIWKMESVFPKTE